MKPLVALKHIVLLITGAVVLLVILLLLLAPYWWPRLVIRIENQLSQQLHATVMLEGVRVTWPLAVRCESIRVVDESATHLEVKNVAVRISARKLLKRTLWVHHADIESVEFNSWPQKPGADSEATDVEWAQVLSFANYLDIVDLRVRELLVNLPAIPEPFLLELHCSLLADLDFQGAHRVLHVRILSAMGSLDMRGVWVQAEEKVQLTIQGDLPDLAQLEWLTKNSMAGVATGRLHVEGPDTMIGMTGSMEIDMEDAVIGDLRLAYAQWRACGDIASVDWYLRGSGHFMDDWALSVDGRLAREHGVTEFLTVHEILLDHSKWPIQSKQPLRLIRDRETLQIQSMLLKVGEGLLEVSGAWAAEKMNILADVREIPISNFGFAGVHPAQGQMEGHLRLSGAPSNPNIRLNLDFQDVRPVDVARWDGPPAQFSFHAALEDRRLQTHWLLEGLSGQPVEGRLAVPLHISFSPLERRWPPEGPVHGQFSASTELDEIASLVLTDVHRIYGNLSMGLMLDGTWDDPNVAGHLLIEDGYYENERWGTLLRDLTVRVAGQRDQLAIQEISATDAEQGRLALQGSIRFNPDEDFPFEVLCELTMLRLLSNETLRAYADGKLLWTGSLSRSELAGQLRIQPLEFRIPERLPPTLVDLNVMDAELNGREAQTVEEESLEDMSAHRLVLNVEISVPDRFFVRGRGLDSEWRGALSIRGTADEPELSGSLSILRGRFNFFGRRMGIDRGLLVFDGSYPPVPQLDVVASTRSGGITGILRLVGRMDAPAIELDSRPVMPEDEILARLLFGRAATRITPWQALTIAQAVNRLRGGHAFDLMGETRRRLGVDQVELRAGDEEAEGLVLQVGKYVSDRIYLEVARGVTAEQSQARLEVELSPTIRLETDIGANAEAGLGILWSWDY